MPLESIHPAALQAAQATHCAGEQDQFWAMHDRLFAHQRELEPFSPHAEALGLDVAQFEACMQSDKYLESIRQDIAEARKVGLTGTPSFILAQTNSEEPTTVTGLAYVRGARPFNHFKSIIDKALTEVDGS